MHTPVSRALSILGVAVIFGAIGASCVQAPALSTPQAAIATPSEPAVQQTSLGLATPTVTTGASTGAAASGLGLESAVSAIYDRVSPSVVQILVQGVSASSPFGQVPQSGEGSGIVVDDQGHILTNYHVVSDAQTIQVTLADGTPLDATLLGSDPGNDLAVIKVDTAKLGANSLPAATLGD